MTSCRGACAPPPPLATPQARPQANALRTPQNALNRRYFCEKHDLCAVDVDTNQTQIDYSQDDLENPIIGKEGQQPS